MLKINKFYNFLCIEGMKKLDDKSIDCIITSPPYWQLRDYGFSEQWGQEITYHKYLDHLWEFMDEAWRVLKDTGTVWINLGDTYGTLSGGIRGLERAKKYNYKRSISKKNIIGQGFNQKKPKNMEKCLLLIPHRFAIGCIDRGWILRNDVIWSKRNGMPESVTDRFSKKHEFIFFFVKNKKYYFDLDSIRDEQKLIIKENRAVRNREYEYQGKYSTINDEKNNRQGMHKNRGNNIIEKRYNLPEKEIFVKILKENYNINDIVEITGLKKTKIEHWFRLDSGFSYPSVEDWKKLDTNLFPELLEINYENDDINKNIEKGKNPGDVSDFWDITTKGSKIKHYASYNDELIKKPILAGCPENGIILDPFAGTGTTLISAWNLKRKFLGFDGNKEYVDDANNRINELTNILFKD